MSDVPLIVWIGTVVGIFAIFILDLAIVSRRSTTVSIPQATRWAIFYVSLALLFGVGLFMFGRQGAGSEFIAGYITEYSLSVDNLFVFVIIIAKFAVPDIAQDKVIFIGIALSLVLRAVFIAAGAAAIAAFSWVFYIFGAFLIYTAFKLATEGENDEEDFQENAALRLMRKVLPTSPEYSGKSFTTQVDGKRLFTPMVIVIVAIGLANVIFALDSIPAIFGLTQDPYIVFTANAFALMGLRQLYFLIGGLLERIVYLNIGLSFILGFIGVKLIIEALHGSGVEEIGPVHLPEIGIVASLGVIVGTLAVTTIASLIKTGRDSRREASEGTATDGSGPSHGSAAESAESADSKESDASSRSVR